MDKLFTILLLESEDSLLTILSYNLERYGYIVNSYKDAKLLLQNIERSKPSLIIASEKLAQGVSGTEICSTIREKSAFRNVPVVIMYEKNAEVQKPEWVTDIVYKPFSPSELINKVRSLLKSDNITNANRVLEYKDLKINIGSFQVSRSGRNIHLGPTEFKILQCLMQIPSRVMTRDDIINQVWGINNNVEPRTVDVHINRLRAALRNDNDPYEQTLIKTIRSGGYSLY